MQPEDAQALAEILREIVTAIDLRNQIVPPEPWQAHTMIGAYVEVGERVAALLADACSIASRASQPDGLLHRFERLTSIRLPAFRPKTIKGLFLMPPVQLTKKQEEKRKKVHAQKPRPSPWERKQISTSRIVLKHNYGDLEHRISHARKALKLRHETAEVPSVLPPLPETLDDLLRDLSSARWTSSQAGEFLDGLQSAVRCLFQDEKAATFDEQLQDERRGLLAFLAVYIRATRHYAHDGLREGLLSILDAELAPAQDFLASSPEELVEPADVVRRRLMELLLEKGSASASAQAPVEPLPPE
jgi:hypothetical protein